MQTNITQAPMPPDCPTQNDWLHWISNKESDWQTSQPDAAEHLRDCAHCQAQVAEVRRYQTLLLRGKAPGLSNEQRASLEERVRMLPLQARFQNVPTQRKVWIAALAAAAVLAAVLSRPWWPEQGAPTFAERVEAARVPSLTNPGPGVATGAVEGELRVADRDGHWRPLMSGDVLRTGQRIRSVGAAGRVVVPGRFELRIGANSELEWLGVSSTMALMRLQQGSVDSQVNKLHPGERYAVLFGAHLAAVVGTRFAVHYAGDASDARVEVTEGAVRVDAAEEPLAPPAETTTMVRAGQRWRFARGVMSLEALTPPEPVTAPPVPVVEPVVAEPMPAAQPVAARSSDERPKAVRKATQPQRRQFLIEVPASGHAEPGVRSPAHPGSGR